MSTFSTVTPSIFQFPLYISSCPLATFISFFFFQAEDGIRDDLVTGVQTCALPIYGGRLALVGRRRARGPAADNRSGQQVSGRNSCGSACNPVSTPVRVSAPRSTEWLASPSKTALDRKSVV